ncbi:MAG TPA: tetratricopeptide repeat protein [Terriglobales bacterium]
MKQRIAILVLFSFIVALSTAVFAQVAGTVRGNAKDENGKPIADATVTWTNLDNGQKYTMKTNKKGDYFSLGVSMGHYNVQLAGQNGQEIFHYNGVVVTADEKIQDFDMAKERASQAKGEGLTPEQLKAQQEQEAKINAKNATIKGLNGKLQEATADANGGNYDGAIAALTEATQMDATYDLIWAKLGETYLVSASKQTDPAEKTKRYGEAAEQYNKAIDLKQKAMDADPKQKTPDAIKTLAQYYNNLANSLGKTGKTDDAVAAYSKAAELDPAGAAQYEYNIGATEVNAGKTDEAIAAFDKAIAADPTKADAYYQKGVGLVGKATTDKDGKVVAPPGTAEAFNKYLELQPTGPYADAAKSMLQYIGSTVETSYGTSKKKTTTPTKKQ